MMHDDDDDDDDDDGCGGDVDVDVDNGWWWWRWWQWCCVIRKRKEKHVYEMYFSSTSAARCPQPIIPLTHLPLPVTQGTPFPSNSKTGVHRDCGRWCKAYAFISDGVVVERYTRMNANTKCIHRMQYDLSATSTFSQEGASYTTSRDGSVGSPSRGRKSRNLKNSYGLSCTRHTEREREQRESWGMVSNRQDRITPTGECSAVTTMVSVGLAAAGSGECTNVDPSPRPASDKL